MRTAALLTAEDFARVAPILGPSELVKGEIIPMSPGGLRHGRVTGNAHALLGVHCRPRKLGWVLTGEAGLVVERRPDTVRVTSVPRGDGGPCEGRRSPPPRHWTLAAHLG